jgi:hypothetical protein
VVIARKDYLELLTLVVDGGRGDAKIYDPLLVGLRGQICRGADEIGDGSIVSS